MPSPSNNAFILAVMMLLVVGSIGITAVTYTKIQIWKGTLDTFMSESSTMTQDERLLAMMNIIMNILMQNILMIGLTVLVLLILVLLICCLVVFITKLRRFTDPDTMENQTGRNFLEHIREIFGRWFRCKTFPKDIETGLEEQEVSAMPNSPDMKDSQT